MTKQEIIQKAYGDYWEIFKDHVNENGYVNCVKNRKISLINYFKISEIEFSGNEVRPKTLKGLEENNGWNIIKTIDDLPDLLDEEIIFYKDQIMTTFLSEDVNVDKKYFLKYSHYRIKEKIKNPIY